VAGTYAGAVIADYIPSEIGPQLKQLGVAFLEDFQGLLSSTLIARESID
jgi:hypothetical protein